MSITKELIHYLRAASVPHALIIEDDPNDAILFRDMLASIGCESDWVKTFEEGIDMLINDVQRYAIVFLDVRIPGIMTWRNIYELGVTIPLVIITGVIDLSIFENTRWGHLTVMQKPVKASEMKAVFATHKIWYADTPVK